MENLIQKDIDYLFDAFLLVAPPSWFPALNCSQQIAGRQAGAVSFGVLVSDPGSLDERCATANGRPCASTPSNALLEVFSCNYW
jgi:hypothetical protein